MQIKPAFIKYKELWREFYAKDDRGIEYDLVCFVGKRTYGHVKCKKKEYAIMDKKLYTWGNGATSYEETMFFRGDVNFALSTGYKPRVIKGIEIYPVWTGGTGMIENGIKIRHILRKITIYDKVFNFIENLINYLEKKYDKKRYEWSNKSGKYLRNVIDWQRLCIKCHRKYDKINKIHFK